MGRKGIEAFRVCSDERETPPGKPVASSTSNRQVIPVRILRGNRRVDATIPARRASVRNVLPRLLSLADASSYCTMTALPRLDRETLDGLLREYGIHVLEASASESEVRVLASLLPTESVASCASKMKGRVSKWLRDSSRQMTINFSAAAISPARRASRPRRPFWLIWAAKAEHHGYDSRPRPPVFVANFALAGSDEERSKRCTRRDSPSVPHRNIDLEASWRLRPIGGKGSRRTLAQSREAKPDVY